MKKLRVFFGLLVFSMITTSLFAETAAGFFSTEDNPVYYVVKFKAGQNCLADKGNGALIETAEFDDQKLPEQQWALIGDASSFYMKSMTGNYVLWNNTDSRFATSSTNKTALYLVESSAEGYYEIGRVGSGNTFNQWGGAGVGKDIGEWTKGDPNNPLQIILAESIKTPAYPKMSDAKNKTWYFIQFNNGSWVIEDKGAGNDVKTASLDANKRSQIWSITGNVKNCQFVNKDGNYLICDNGTIKTATTADSKGFKIAPTSEEGIFEIMHLSTSGKGFNMNGGAGKDKNIALWNSGDGGNLLSFTLLDDVLGLAEFEIEDYIPVAPEEKLTLWYTKPATATGVDNPWMEYSLPLGNGQLGASLFGGVARDEILFNEKTLWSGGPNEYGYYLPFGSIYIDDISGDFESAPVKNYYRDLNLKTATGTVKYKNAEGVEFTRQYIVSNPDKAIVTRITASEAGKLNFCVKMASGKPTVNAKTVYEGDYAQFTGKLQTVSYNATLKVVANGGTTTTTKEGITVENADAVLIVLAGSTDFVGDDASHVNGNAENLPAENKALVDAVAEKGWDAVYAAHVADHQKYFTRVELELEGVENNMPTNELIIAYNAASGVRNLMLEQLYYNYGRYLSIASSRGVDLPNNLQGIWNNTCTPPWHSDIHANINVQMNYWPVSAGNMNEMYEPFLNYIINEASQPEWQNSAKIASQERGWTCLTENNIFGGVSTFATNYVIANAWYVTHLWQHYRYTLDKEYLAKAFPAMLGAAQFWADRMVLAEDGTYECPNEYSPEHGPGSENAVAHAQQIAWEALDNTLKAADILGGVDAGVIKEADYNLIKERWSNMDRGLAIEEYEAHTAYKTNDDGSQSVAYTWPASRNGVNTGDKILREWKYSRFYASGDQGHRHMSHLMALFPFGQLTPASPYFEPAINSMKLRGDESTGWSMGWKINLWARALMGDRSHAILRKALKHSTTYGTDQGQGGIYYNLFDSHAPFQIDGNFGATSGVNEMLLQSHTDVIDILPALPSEWVNGSVKGLKAIGDFTVDIEWKGNQASKVAIVNNQGQPCYVKCNALDEAVVTVNGVAVELGEKVAVNGLECYQIASVAADVIVIDFSQAKQTDTTALENIIDETEYLINECYDYYAKEVALQTTNDVGAYYVSTNAQSSKEGPIKNLVDGDENSHFHTEYTNDMGGAHYIQVALGSGNELSSFRFKYATRKAQTDFPKTIEIHGSTNGTNYELIETVTNLPAGNSNETFYYKSNAIKGNKSYSYLRFVVTATNSGHTEAGGNVFFHMAEFDLMPRTAEYVNNYPSAQGVPAAVEAAKIAIASAKTSLEGVLTAVEYNAEYTAMQEAYQNLVNAMYVPVDNVTLDKTESTIEKGKTLTLTATVNPSDATDAVVSWSTSKSSVVTVKNGVVTAVGVGTATITAKAGDKTATCTVTVVIPATSIVLDNTTATLLVDETLTLEAIVNPDDTTDKLVWSTSNASVATVEDGVVTAVGVGTATITAKAGNKTATCTVTVDFPEGIEEVLENTELVIYDLNGNLVINHKELKRGIYIINGVKTMVK